MADMFTNHKKRRIMFHKIYQKSNHFIPKLINNIFYLHRHGLLTVYNFSKASLKHIHAITKVFEHESQNCWQSKIYIFNDEEILNSNHVNRRQRRTYTNIYR